MKRRGKEEGGTESAKNSRRERIAQYVGRLRGRERSR